MTRFVCDQLMIGIADDYMLMLGVGLAVGVVFGAFSAAAVMAAWGRK